MTNNEVRVKHEPPRGILNLRSGETFEGLSRYWPSGDLAPFVEHYWIVHWNLSEPRMVETLPDPSIHMVLESSGSSEIVGIMRKRFSRMLEGREWVLGTKFRPGGFRAFVKSSVAAFTGRRVPVEEVWGARAEGLSDRVMACVDDRDGIAIVESFLRGFSLPVSESMTLAMQVAARIAEDRAITRVDQLAGELRTSVRTLQRVRGRPGQAGKEHR